MSIPLSAYLGSSAYQHDLDATHQLWTGPATFGTAGIFIFLSYLSVPLLTAVQPATNPSRVVTMQLGLESEREKRFLLRLLGLSRERGWTGGIRNGRVRALAEHVACNHVQFIGMEQEYMNFIGGIIALSVLRVHALRGSTGAADIVAGYWSYIHHALSLLGVALLPPAEVERGCEQFIEQYAAPDALGQQLLGTLLAVYPQYVEKALPVLFPKTRVVVTAMLEEYNAKHA